MSDDKKHEAVMAAITSLQGNHEQAMAAIASLQGATELGFARVDARFDRLETRVTSVEGEVRGMRLWRDRVDARLDHLDAYQA